MLVDIMENIGTPSLRAFAAALNVATQRLYSVSKQPEEGQVYDKNVCNWTAIERFITRRLVPEGTEGFHTLEEVVAKAKEIEETLPAPRAAGAAGAATIVVDGKEIVKRKYVSYEKENDSLICLKNDDNVYKIVFQTVSHTVLRPVDPEGTFCSESLKLISNSVLNQKGIGPIQLAAAIASRFDKFNNEEAAE